MSFVVVLLARWCWVSARKYIFQLLLQRCQNAEEQIVNLITQPNRTMSSQQRHMSLLLHVHDVSIHLPIIVSESKPVLLWLSKPFGCGYRARSAVAIEPVLLWLSNPFGCGYRARSAVATEPVLLWLSSPFGYDYNDSMQSYI